MREVWLRKNEQLDLKTLAELVKLEHRSIKIHRIGQSTLHITPNGPELVEKPTCAKVIPISR